MNAAAAVLLLGLLGLPGPASPDAAVPVEIVQQAEVVQRATPTDDGGLIAQWRVRQRFRRQGDIVRAGEAENGLRERRRRDAVDRSESIAGALVLEGLEALELERYAEAIDALRLAREFDPQMPAAHLGLARARWETNDWLSAARAWLAAVAAGWRNWSIRHIAINRLGWALLWGIPIAATALFCFLFLRTIPLIHHGLKEGLGERLPPTTAATVAAIALFVPIAMPRAIIWLPLFWLVLAAPYLTRCERVTAMVFLAAAAVCGLASFTIIDNITRQLDPRMLQVASAAEGGVGAERERAISDLSRKEPTDAILHLLHADQLRGRGDHMAAIQEYARAIQLDPSLHAAHNNTGTLFFSLGEYGTAVRWFRQAIDLDPSAMVAHYNLYLTQEHLFDFAAAENTLADAQAIDLTEMTHLLSDREGRQARLDVLQERVPVALALAHAQAAISTETAPDGPRAAAGWPFILFAGLALALFVGRGRSSAHPVRCPSCGRVACRRCALNLDRDRTCASCLAVAHRSTALPRRAREAKLKDIAAHRRAERWLSRLAGFFLPGGRQIWHRQAVGGGLLLLVAGVAVADLLSRRLLPAPIYTPTPTRILGSVLPVAIPLACAWIIGLAYPAATTPSPASDAGGKA
ncbi:MAG: tetratricopeptide repeat protein [Acidobacteriota bacterium]